MSVQEISKEYDSILENMKNTIEKETSEVHEQIIEVTALKNQKRNPAEKASAYSDEFYNFKQRVQEELNAQRESIEE